MNIIANKCISRDSLTTNIINTVHDQTLGVIEIILTVGKSVTNPEYKELFESSLNLIDIYSIAKLPSKCKSIHDNTWKAHSLAKKGMGTRADLIQSINKVVFNTLILTKTAIKVTLALGKRKIIPVYSQLKTVSVPLAFSLSIFSTINSAININRLEKERRSLPKMGKNPTRNRKAFQAYYASHLSSFADKNSDLNKSILKIHEKQLEMTISRRVIAQMNMAKTDQDKVVSIENARTLIDRKLKVEYANITSTLCLTTMGLLCFTSVNPLVPLAFKGTSLAIDAGIAWYNIYGLNKGLKPITDELLQVG